MPPAPRGQRRHRRQGGGGSSATASRGDSGDKRPSARELPPGRLFQRVEEKRQGREVILEEMEPQEARGWQPGMEEEEEEGERRQQGQRGQEGTEGMEGEAWGDPAPGAGSCQPDSIPIPHLSPGVWQSPLFPGWKLQCLVLPQDVLGRATFFSKTLLL